MFQFKHQLIAFCLTIVGLAPGAIASSVVTPEPAGNTVVVTDLHPFTHVARIPAGADLSSIKFESVKAVKIATRRKAATNKQYCDQEYHEPGGSMYCPYTRDEFLVPAYQVRYSYSGPPMTSDEYGGTYFTFSVYLRPDELSAEARQTISAGKISGADVEAFFKVTASRDTYRSVVIDEEKSAFCDGNYVDGNWTLSNPECQDKVTYKTVTSPSSYVTVKVDPASRQFEAAAEYVAEHVTG